MIFIKKKKHIMEQDPRFEVKMYIKQQNLFKNSKR